MKEVGELAVHQAGDSCEQVFIRVDKFTKNDEQSAIKLLAVRLLRFTPEFVVSVFQYFFFNS